MDNRRIQIHVTPHTEHYAVEKSDAGGKKGRYLTGIASGLKEDAHSEKVTQNCIASLCKQAEENEILLFPDVHGIKESEDIGILKHFEVMPNGDWYVEFRLHDKDDNVDRESVEKANKLWAQVNGLPPYTKPRQKGFSIEGYIPTDAVLEDKKERLGIIDDMVLEGVVVVPKPAYQDSYIHAIYKALNVTPPWKIQKDIKARLHSSLIRKDMMGSFDNERYGIEAVRDQLISEAVDRNVGKPEQLRQDLRLALSEYSELVVDLIANQPAFASVSVSTAIDGPYGSEVKRVQKSARLTLLTDLNSTLDKLVKSKIGEQNATY